MHLTKSQASPYIGTLNICLPHWVMQLNKEYHSMQHDMQSSTGQCFTQYKRHQDGHTSVGMTSHVLTCSAQPWVCPRPCMHGAHFAQSAPERQGTLEHGSQAKQYTGSDGLPAQAAQSPSVKRMHRLVIQKNKQLDHKTALSHG